MIIIDNFTKSAIILSQMSYLSITIPTISESEQSPLVTKLICIIQKLKEIISRQKEKIDSLKDEIAVLKKQKKKPKFKSSNMDKECNNQGSPNKRPGSNKKSKKDDLEIHETIKITPQDIPEGSKIKKYHPYDVQGLIIKSHNVRYLLEEWVGPNGEYYIGKLPDHIIDHFSPELKSYILYQYYNCYVTRPLLLEQLNEFGVNISIGQIDNILTQNKDNFHQEKDDILQVGLSHYSFIQTDDTSSRHNGKNGYCTFIGNNFFSWFQSTPRKSRINFLELLNAGQIGYVLNVDSVDYMKRSKLPKSLIKVLICNLGLSFQDKKDWINFLNTLGIKRSRHIQIATEGALLSNAFNNGLDKQLIVLSDDAGQFNVPLLYHALCWIHAERTIKKLIPFTDSNREALTNITTKIWDFYGRLKLFKDNPSEATKVVLEATFDNIFQTRTCFLSLNQALNRIYKNKSELLLVLSHPEIPLHNNESERDIREYVKRRKISGGTRSELGRQCRDTFISLKKTSRKLGLSFWKYLNDRVRGTNQIPQLGQLVKVKIKANNSIGPPLYSMEPQMAS